MGRRFPEFCTLQAVCRVSAKASPSATGDARVASYQAAINSVSAKYYADRPFMVEVLSKWLEMNQDFIRDPHGYGTSDSPTPPPPTAMDLPSALTMRGTPDQALILATDRALTHESTTVDGEPSPLLGDRVPVQTADSSLQISASGVESQNSGDPSSNNRSDLHIPSYQFFPTLRIPGIGILSSAFTLGPCGWFIPQKPSAQQTSNPPKTHWFNLSFPCAGWWDLLKRSFMLRIRRSPLPSGAKSSIDVPPLP